MSTLSAEVVLAAVVSSQSLRDGGNELSRVTHAVGIEEVSTFWYVLKCVRAFGIDTLSHGETGEECACAGVTARSVAVDFPSDLVTFLHVDIIVHGDWSASTLTIVGYRTIFLGIHERLFVQSLSSSLHEA